MKNNYLARQKRQFKGLCKKISKNWNSLSSNQRENLLSRFRRLYDNLKNAFARPALSKMMGTAAVVLMTVGTAQAQNFTGPAKDTFNISPLGTSTPGNPALTLPAFVDIDGDGDMDLFTGKVDGNFLMQTNLGTATAPDFTFGPTTVLNNPYGLTDVGDYSRPTFVDIDADGDMDLFVGDHYYGDMVFFENTGSSTNPSFGALTRNPFNLNPVSGYFRHTAPTFVDIDGDGDEDLFSGLVYGSIYFYENTGDSSAASFANPVQDTFGFTSVTSWSTIDFADIDGDGDMDAFVGEQSGNFSFFRNSGTVNSPSFDALVVNPFGLSDIGAISSPVLVDIDGDNDIDLFSGDYYGGFYYFENLGGLPSSITQPELGKVVLYPNPVLEELTIELSKSSNYQIRITDITGLEVYSEFLQGENNLQLSTKAWPAGLYLLQVRDEEGRIETQKVVKQ